MINTGEQEAYILVDRFIETGMPFAMYRIPGEKVIHLMVQLNSEVSLFNDIEEWTEWLCDSPFSDREGYTDCVAEAG